MLLSQFTAFREREDTFSLGICNGCQFMALLGWIPGIRNKHCRFLHNASGRFEARFSAVKICESRASNIWFNDMIGSVLGVWVAHGEGQVFFADDGAAGLVEKESLGPPLS